MLHIIPTPKKIEEYGGLNPISPQIYSADEQGKDLVPCFCSYAFKAFGIPFFVERGGIAIEFGGQEGHYTIDSREGMKITAGGKSGLGYALATLLQILKVENGQYFIPEVVIADYPDCDYRGLMVDLARNWHDFFHLFEYIDLCFFYKIKYLQLHFVDNESYTLYSDICPLAPSDRHYSKQQIRELVLYANERQIELVPEFETPGHSNALINAYPLIFGTEQNTSGTFEINGSKVEHSIVCVGCPSAREYTLRMIKEVIDMFPYSHYIHLGGDEANIKAWNNSELCQEYMKQNKLKDEKELYTFWIKEVTDFVIDCGKTPIVWEGFSANANIISKKVKIIAWESFYKLAPDLIKDGFDIINCSWQPLYIVPSRAWSVPEILAWNIYNWQHWWEKSAAYGQGINVSPTKQVMGGQLCAWESTYELEIEKIRENLAPLSERTWSINRVISDENFIESLKMLLPLVKRISKSF